MKKAKQIKKPAVRFVGQVKTFKEVSGKAASVAKQLRPKFKDRAAATKALKPTFAKVYTGRSDTKLNGKAKGKAMAGYNALKYLLRLMFPTKANKASAKKRTNVKTQAVKFAEKHSVTQIKAFIAVLKKYV